MNKIKNSYKDLYKFIKVCNPDLISLYNDFYKRPDPINGDKFIFNNDIIIFRKVLLDPSFDKGVAFDYIFEDKNRNEVKIKSINYVEDDKILNEYEQHDFLGFWKYCQPVLIY